MQNPHYVENEGRGIRAVVISKMNFALEMTQSCTLIGSTIS
jgi:hypothetical protein